MANIQQLALNESGQVDAYAWPGGYPIYYVCSDGGVLCHKCVNDNLALIQEAIANNDNSGWRVDGRDINWEDPDLSCDNCGKRIESAYAEDESESDNANR